MPSSQRCEAKTHAPGTRAKNAVLLITAAIGCTNCRRARCPMLDLLVTNNGASDQRNKDYHSNGRTHPCVKHADPCTDDLLPDGLRAQVAALRKLLTKGWHVFGAVHPDSPSISDALDQIRDAGIDRLIVIPMHPQFSPSLGADQLDEFYACLRRMQPDLHIEVRSSWHDDSAFIDATAHHLHAFATANSLNPRNSVLIFQARRTQEDTARYREQVAATAELVRKRLGWPVGLCATVYGDFGAAGSPRGEVAEQVDSLDHSAARSVLICPISDLSRRPCEHSVLEAAYRADLCPRSVHLCPAANDSDEFIRALAQLVRRPRHSAFDLAEEPQPLFPNVDIGEQVSQAAGSLFMIGAEVRGRLGQGDGPALRYCSPQDFRRIKRPHLETIDLLRHASQCCDLRECWIWNTCTRFELYGWLPEGVSPRALNQTIERLRALVFPSADPRRINLLTGPEVRRHMLRTASGLNSQLIGDAEVLDQLDAARRAAEHAGSARVLTNDLVDDTIQLVRRLRRETAWQAFENRYCATVLSRLADRLADPISRGQILVVGGSTTSCSILETLVKDFRVPRERLSLIYRGRRKGVLNRRLHNAAGEGQVSIVESYTDSPVLAAIARSDLVFLGIDQREAIATGDAISSCRDLGARPLTVLDFNTFGSVVHAHNAPGLDFLTAAQIGAGIDDFNADATSRPEFAAALGAAEAWIAEKAGIAPASNPERYAGGPDSDPSEFPASASDLLCGTTS